MNHHKTERGVNVLVGTIFAALSLVVPCAFPTAAHAAEEDTVVRGEPAPIEIPENYGFVRESFRGNGGRFILYIEDIHGNVEAQRNISRIIAHAATQSSRGRMSLIAVEGAQGLIDPSLLQSCPDTVAQRKVADVLLAEGFISGAEYYAVLSDMPVPLYGIEKKELYTKNLENYVRVLRIKEKGARYFETLREIIGGIQRSAYPQEAEPLLRMQDGRRKGEVPFSRYARSLYRLYCDSKENRPLLEPYFEKLTAFRAFIDADTLEKGIDLKGMAVQRQQLLRDLGDRLDKDGMSRLVEKSLLFRTGRLAVDDYYRFLERMAARKAVGLERYPDLLKYMRLQKQYRQIRNEELFDDADVLAGLLIGVHLRTPELREIARFGKHLDVLEKMFSFRLSRRDIEYMIANRGEFTADVFAGFLRKHPHAPAARQDEYLDLIFSSVIYVQEFYDTALARDEAFFANMADRLRSEKDGFAVLVTGGFHTEGVARRLRADGVSYMIVAPRMAAAEDNSVYLQRLLEISPPFARSLLGPAHLALEVLSAVNPMTERAQRNKEYLAMQEVMLASALMYAGSPQARELMPDDIGRLFADKQAQWISRLKRLKGCEQAQPGAAAARDADCRRVTGLFGNISCDYGKVRWEAGSLYIPFSVHLDGTRKSAVFVLLPESGVRAAKAAAAGADTVRYELIDEREYSGRIEKAGDAVADIGPALAGFSDDEIERLYREVKRLAGGAGPGIARQVRVIDDLIVFERSKAPSRPVGECLKSRMVLPRFTSLVRECDKKYPGLCIDPPKGVAEKIGGR